MGFMDDINEAKKNSGKFLNVQEAVETIISTKEFEEKLKNLCIDAINNGEHQAEVILSFIKENRGDITVELTSSNLMKLHYELARGVNQDNITNIAEGYQAIVKRLIGLGITGEKRPNANMSQDRGMTFSFDNTIEHQTYENRIIINLDSK